MVVYFPPVLVTRPESDVRASYSSLFVPHFGQPLRPVGYNAHSGLEHFFCPGKVMEINERLRAVAPVRKDSLKESVGFVVYGSNVYVHFS